MSAAQPHAAPVTRSPANGRTALRLRHQVQLGEHVSALAWPASGDLAVAATLDGGAQAIRSRRRAQTASACSAPSVDEPRSTFPGTPPEPSSPAWRSPDERYIAMTHLGGTVSVLQLSTSHSIQFGGFPGKIRRLAWSHDSRRLAVASGERVAVFGFSPVARTARARVLRGHRGGVAALAFFATPGGHLLASGCETGERLLWAQARDMRRTGALELGHPIEQLFVSPDGRWLGVACRGGDLRIFSTAR